MTSEFIYPSDTPVMRLDATAAFQNLTNQEQLYAHYLSKASLYGSLIVLFQTSPESPLIFALLKRIFGEESLGHLKTLAVGGCQLTEEEWKAFLLYAAAFYNNMGNYRGFGDSKFVPNLPKAKFEAVVKQSAAYEKDAEFIDFLWEHCHERLYSLEANHLMLGYPSTGTTTYFSKNMTKEESEIVDKFLQANKIEGYNTRAFKDPISGEYIIRFASIKDTKDSEEREFMDRVKVFEIDGSRFRLERGDYAPLLELVNLFLAEAGAKALNSTEQAMLAEYIKHFRSGSLDQHKEGSKLWVQDKGPIVETYIGFIETYRDPAGQRAEFEGFVAMVNKEMSKKFNQLVQSAEVFLPLLPWDKEFEKIEFLKPDFTSLDVLTFAGSGTPLGINIPNYDEVRELIGFKNVSLGNVITASSTAHNFLSKEDSDLLNKHLVTSTEVIVGLHELLGHGSGRLLRVDKDGKLNYDPTKTINPLTGKPVSSHYKPGDSYDSKFGSLSSPYEECRAECVGLYLSLNRDVLKIFGVEGKEEIREVIYVCWLEMIYKGIDSLKMWAGKWLQAHSQARYVITRVILESVSDLINVKLIEKAADGKPDLLITMSKDLNLIETRGKQAIGNFLQKLQIYKSTGDAKAGVEMFESYSTVNDELEYPYLKFRDIIIERKKPRRLFVSSSTKVKGEGTVELKDFDASLEGIIESFNHHLSREDIEKTVVNLWKTNQKYF